MTTFHNIFRDRILVNGRKFERLDTGIVTYILEQTYLFLCRSLNVPKIKFLVLNWIRRRRLFNISVVLDPT